MRQSKAVILPAARGTVAVGQVWLADPGPGEVLLRLEACGICHSDLFVAGLEKLPRAPVTLGHEGIGLVEAVGPGVTEWAHGDRAGITFLATTCGACEWCLSGRERFCPKQSNFGFSRDGALSEYAVVPAAALVRVPASLSAGAAAPLCCAGWTAYGALREAGLASGQTVALFGFGGLGHLALQMARLRHLRVAVADVSESKLEMARANGAEIALDAANAGRTLQKEHGGVDAAIVLTASPEAIGQAFRALKRNGTLVLVGLSQSPYELPLTDTILKGVTIRGSYLGTGQELREVFELACAGAIRAHVHMHDLEETPLILESMRRGEVVGRAVANCVAR
ncbi:MAG TPA: alcohol dehydrogenase catalytic domain-containing protein [Bryobacteraceae bacterium]|nr:alcohol dehydrogenase catalytic domain-containing protein [Bryobacteraceae bacterium]